MFKLALRLPSARHLIPYYAEIFSASSLAFSLGRGVSEDSLVLVSPPRFAAGCGLAPPPGCFVHEKPELAATQRFHLQCWSDLDLALTSEPGVFCFPSFQLWFSLRQEGQRSTSPRPLSPQLSSSPYSMANCALASQSLARHDDLDTQLKNKDNFLSFEVDFLHSACSSCG